MANAIFKVHEIESVNAYKIGISTEKQERNRINVNQLPMPSLCSLLILARSGLGDRPAGQWASERSNERRVAERVIEWYHVTLHHPLAGFTAAMVVNAIACGL